MRKAKTLANLEAIRRKAEAHAAKFPTFKLDRFMERVESCSASRIGQFVNMTTAEVNRSFARKESLRRWVENDSWREENAVYLTPLDGETKPQLGAEF